MRNMRTIGITGGVGSGKTAILSYIKEHCNCEVLLADQIAHEVCLPDGSCYHSLVQLLGEEILEPDGKIHRGRMAARIFGDKELLTAVNEQIHPAVKTVILEKIEAYRAAGVRDFVFVEAALLIEEGYGSLLDELWYIYADESVRRQRLKESRGYSEEKIQDIFRAQLTEEEFRKHCRVVLDNSGSLQEVFHQIDRKLEEYL